MHAAAPKTAAERDRLRTINTELIEWLKNIAEHGDEGSRTVAQTAIAYAKEVTP